MANNPSTFSPNCTTTFGNQFHSALDTAITIRKYITMKRFLGNIIYVPIIDTIIDRFGIFKPRPQPINDADELWLMNNTAFRNPLKPNEWLAEFVACFFRHNTGDKPAKDIADFLHALGIVKGEAAEKIAAKQIELFLNIIQPGRTIELQVNGPSGGTLNLGPAGTNGISSNILPLPNLVSYEGNQVITNAGKLPSGYGQLNGFETMTTVFAEPTGWGVISDIDDTIKVRPSWLLYVY